MNLRRYVFSIFKVEQLNKQQLIFLSNPLIIAYVYHQFQNHLRTFISKVNKQFTQVTTVRENDNDEEIDMEEYLFDGEFVEQQDETTEIQTITKLKELDVEIADVRKIKAENVESETIEEVIYENNDDEIVDTNSNEEVEQIEEVVMDNEVYEEEHLLDEVYLEEQV